MVATSRKPHAKPAPPLRQDRPSKPERPAAPAAAADVPAPEPAPDAEAAPAVGVAPQDPPPPCAANLRALYDHLVPHLGRWRAEAIDGRLVVRPVGSPDHQWRATLLAEAFLSIARERGWRAWAGLDVCLPGSRLPYEPDFVMGPKDAPRWGDREVFTDGLIMVGEVVSPGSVDIDRDEKPGIYARGGVPILLLVDPLGEPATVTVFSEPRDGRYARSTSVVMGEKLHIPEPVDFTFDTSVLQEE
jgi:Uma2 family endonuclease